MRFKRLLSKKIKQFHLPKIKIFGLKKIAVIAFVGLVIFFIILPFFVWNGLVKGHELEIIKAYNKPCCQAEALEILKKQEADFFPKEEFVPKNTVNSNKTTNDYTERLRVPILMYHYIEVPAATSTLKGLFHKPEIFEAQLKSLQTAGYNSVLIQDIDFALIGKTPLPPKPIALTFDDGYGDMYTKAFSLLKKYNMKGTMYVIVAALDTPGYLTKPQAKEMADSGLVEIASHTVNHINLKEIADVKAIWEINESKIRLEKILNRPVIDFAYPFGLFNEKTEQACARAGYLSCASTYPGVWQSYDRRFSLYRLRPAYRIGSDLIDWLEKERKSN